MMVEIKTSVSQIKNSPTDQLMSETESGLQENVEIESRSKNQWQFLNKHMNTHGRAWVHHEKD